MNRTDLHTHTTASDGTLSPSRLVALAKKEGLSSLAVTDHDTLQGLPEALEAGKRLGIPVIPGVELSTAINGKTVHLLGLFVDPESRFLNGLLEEMRSRRQDRNRRMLKALQDAGLPVFPEDFPPSLPMLTKTQVGAVLAQKGFASSPMEAVQRYLLPGGVGYVPKSRIAPEECAAAIRKAGGAVILAHVNQISSQPEEALAAAETLLSQKTADGLETLYCQYDSFWEQETQKLAEKFRCLRSGGSDFHGDMKPGLSLGKGYGNLRIPEEFAREIQAFCRKNAG